MPNTTPTLATTLAPAIRRHHPHLTDADDTTTLTTHDIPTHTATTPLQPLTARLAAAHATMLNPNEDVAALANGLADTNEQERIAIDMVNNSPNPTEVQAAQEMLADLTEVADEAHHAAHHTADLAN